MPVYLTTYYQTEEVGICNYLKGLFSTYRINLMNNGDKTVPCVDKEFEWIFKSFFTNDDFIHDTLIPEAKKYFTDLPDDYPPFTFDNTESDGVYHKNCGWRFYLHKNDPISLDPFANEWFLREMPLCIDFRYTNIPQFMRDIYTSIIKKFTIHQSILERVDFFKNQIGGDYLGVHVRTWNKGLGSDHTAYDRHNWYLQTRNYLINSINSNPLKKVLFCTDNVEEIKALMPYIQDKEVYFTHTDSNLNKLQNDFVDLLILSNSKHLIGTNNSTFSELAWWYADCNIPVDII